MTQQCISLPVNENVVSVYTTHPTTMGTNPPIDVYHQIASNIAERITSPIYKFLGLNVSKTEGQSQAKSGPTTPSDKAWGKIELQEDQDLNKQDVKPIDNDISKERDVEEVSPDAVLPKADKKPEKITLYSNYLPVLAKGSGFSRSGAQIEAKNDTWNDDDDGFGWDNDREVAKPKEGPFVYILEMLGSIIQLLWGGLMALFRPAAASSASKNL
ncbi:hypothetical protein SFRURICE_009251 [Spodoptera frugiperda]|nr:hypothetical protein SFRURICE_009251 [Spodoptera frugiperda]